MFGPLNLMFFNGFEDPGRVKKLRDNLLEDFSRCLSSNDFGFPEVFGGLVGFRKLRDACRIHFHLSRYLESFRVPSYDQKPRGGILFNVSVRTIFLFFSFFYPTGLETSARRFPAISHQYHQICMVWRRKLGQNCFEQKPGT